MKLKKPEIILPLITVVFCIAVAFSAIKCAAGESGAKKYCDLIIRFSEGNDIRAEFTFAVIKAESDFNKDAVSKKGATGLMQLMPETAVFIAEKIGYEKEIDLKDAKCNVMLGCAYIAYLKEKFVSEREVLCAYNAGEGTVRKWLDDEKYSSNGKTLDCIPYRETEAYVEKTLSLTQRYRRFLERKGYYGREKNKRQLISLFHSVSRSVYNSGFAVYNRRGEFSESHIRICVGNE